MTQKVPQLFAVLAALLVLVFSSLWLAGGRGRSQAVPSLDSLFREAGPNVETAVLLFASHECPCAFMEAHRQLESALEKVPPRWVYFVVVEDEQAHRGLSQSGIDGARLRHDPRHTLLKGLRLVSSDLPYLVVLSRAKPDAPLFAGKVPPAPQLQADVAGSALRVAGLQEPAP